MHSRRAFVLLSLIVFASGASRTASAQTADLDTRIVKLVPGVSEECLSAILKKLESFETRNTLSSINSPSRGIGAAREWILQEMRGYSSRLQVSFDSYTVPPQGR